VVRTLPRTTRVRASAVLLAGGLLLTGVTPLAYAADHKHAGGAAGHSSSGDLKQKKKQVEKRLAGASSDLDESSSQLRSATAALQAAQTQLSSAQAHLADTRGQLAAAAALDQQMAAKLVAAKNRLVEAQANLVEGRHKITEEQDQLGRIVVANYQTGDPSLMGLSMVLTTQDPTELTGQLNSVRNVMDKESVVLSRLEASKALLTVQEHEVATAKAGVARQRRAAAANLRRKQGLESEAEAAEASVHNLVDARATARQEAANARAADMAQLQNLRSEKTRIATVLKQRADAARARAAAAAAAAGSAGPVLGDGGPVSSNGFLNYPVNGTVTSPFGWRIHPIYGYRSLHDGVDFGVGCGTPIRAAAAGTVVERYFQTAWGNRVIIDHGFHHGVGLATISNHLNAPAVVAPGEHVSRGQIVGYVGTTGWSTGCHLHFTVMQNGSPVNPMNWF
jgi:murein DD-endopeptidase MepM/ murein hydrolase activator NlpD